MTSYIHFWFDEQLFLEAFSQLILVTGFLKYQYFNI
jgi:hypothetical protein